MIDTVTPEILNLIATLIGEDEVEPDDNFFAIGGTSMAAANLAVQIEEAHGVVLALRVVFTAQTLREIADEVDRLIAARDESAPAAEGR